MTSAYTSGQLPIAGALIMRARRRPFAVLVMAGLLLLSQASLEASANEVGKGGDPCEWQLQVPSSRASDDLVLSVGGNRTLEVSIESVHSAVREAVILEAPGLHSLPLPSDSEDVWVSAIVEPTETCAAEVVVPKLVPMVADSVDGMHAALNAFTATLMEAADAGLPLTSTLDAADLCSWYMSPTPCEILAEVNSLGLAEDSLPPATQLKARSVDSSPGVGALAECAKTIDVPGDAWQAASQQIRSLGDETTVDQGISDGRGFQTLRVQRPLFPGSTTIFGSLRVGAHLGFTSEGETPIVDVTIFGWDQSSFLEAATGGGGGLLPFLIDLIATTEASVLANTMVAVEQTNGSFEEFRLRNLREVRANDNFFERSTLDYSAAGTEVFANVPIPNGSEFWFNVRSTGDLDAAQNLVGQSAGALFDNASGGKGIALPTVRLTLKTDHCWV